jgi:hypothetical protein
MWILAGGIKLALDVAFNARMTPMRANVVGPPDGALRATSLANKSRFKVGQPNLVGPSVPADRRWMTAPEIGAIDQETANARRAHFPEGDFLLAAFCGSVAGESWHAPLIAPTGPGVKPLDIGPLPRGHTIALDAAVDAFMGAAAARRRGPI